MSSQLMAELQLLEEAAAAQTATAAAAERAFERGGGGGESAGELGTGATLSDLRDAVRSASSALGWFRLGSLAKLFFISL
jgi:hypothetical protein